MCRSPLKTALLAILSVSSLASAAPQDYLIEYLPLSNKGLKYDEVSQSMFQFPRKRPEVRFLTAAPEPKKKGSVERQRVEISLKERNNVKQDAAEIAFGFPFASGALYDVEKIRVTDAKGDMELPHQAHVLALWPDGSVRSAYLQFQAPFDAEETKKVAVEFGNEVSPSGSQQKGVQINEGRESIRVSTGAMEVSIGKRGFAPLKEVYLLKPTRRLIAESGGYELRDEEGALFSSAFGSAEKVKIERNGPLDAQIRIEGPFNNEKNGGLMRYVARLRFVAGSTKVDLSIKLINDAIKTEFTDTTSLSLALSFRDKGNWSATLDSGSTSVTSDGPLAVAQWDENAVTTLVGKELSTLGGRSSGSGEVTTGDDKVQIAFRDFWQRWPKSLRSEPGRLVIDLLPQQPEGYGKDLPDHLRFPFLEGRYRLKWGMAFTERFTIDFQPNAPFSTLAKTVNVPVQAIYPVDYLAATKAFGEISSVKTRSRNREKWDQYVARSFTLHAAEREQRREYGYLNYGDWHGERGRNWGNNEYDRAHGLFSEFLQTGKPEYIDQAIAAARHQADVDIVHAYPDARYIGANFPHSIGHTGMAYHATIPKTWSIAYAGWVRAGNGHTWADGMASSWLLTGDPFVQESLVALGEHICWEFTPGFKMLGSHERSAGWSIQAILAAWRATADPEYLKAAESIAKVSLAEWNKDSGIWQHKLPAAHAAGRSDVMGNSVYNIGILLNGLARYHEVSRDPEVFHVMERASDWLLRSWDPGDRSWPYSATVEGGPADRLTANLNPLIYPPLAYIGLETKNRDLLDVAEKALARTVEGDLSDTLAKEFSIKLHATSSTLATLDQAYDQGLLAPRSPQSTNKSDE